MADKGIKSRIVEASTDIIEGQLRSLSRTDSEGGTRYLRPSRYNERVYKATLELMGPLTKYERSILRDNVNNLRMKRNNETKSIRNAADILWDAEIPSVSPRVRPTFEVMARVFEESDTGHIRSRLVLVGGMEAVDAGLVIDRLKRDDEVQDGPLIARQYERIPRGGAPGTAPPNAKWRYTHAQVWDRPSN